VINFALDSGLDDSSVHVHLLDVDVDVGVDVDVSDVNRHGLAGAAT